MNDHATDYDPPSKRDLCIELGLAWQPTEHAHRERYAGLRVDEHGYTASGEHYEQYDGGGQDG